MNIHAAIHALLFSQLLDPILDSLAIEGFTAEWVVVMRELEPDSFAPYRRFERLNQYSGQRPDG